MAIIRKEIMSKQFCCQSNFVIKFSKIDLRDY